MRAVSEAFSFELPDTYGPLETEKGVEYEDWYSRADHRSVKSLTFWMPRSPLEVDELLRSLARRFLGGLVNKFGGPGPFEIELADHENLRLAAGLVPMNEAGDARGEDGTVHHIAAGAVIDPRLVARDRFPCAVLIFTQFAAHVGVQPTQEEVAAFVRETLFSVAIDAYSGSP